MKSAGLVAPLDSLTRSKNEFLRRRARDVADAVYEPQIATHLPGLANVVSDVLSREHDPTLAFVLPVVPHGCTEVHVEDSPSPASGKERMIRGV